MIYNKEAILNLCADVLGKDCDGIFIHYNRFEDGEDLPFALGECLDRFLETGETIMDCTPYAGVTKLVLVPEHGDYVIKIPITGVYCEIGNDGSDYYDHDFDEDEYEIIARSTKKNINIFEEEENIYKEANNKAKEILLPNIYIGDFNGIPIYIQQKITEIFSYSPSCSTHLSKNERMKTKEVFQKSRDLNEEDSCIDYYPCDATFIYDIIKYYGEEKAVEICKLLRKLNDLHSSNYGYVGRVPKIHDFGGYRSDGAYWSWI